LILRKEHPRWFKWSVWFGLKEMPYVPPTLKDPRGGIVFTRVEVRPYNSV